MKGWGSSEMELVVTLNGVVALGGGLVALFELGVPLALALGLVPLLFIVLFASLYDPRTKWLAASLGSLTCAALGAALGVAFLGKHHEHGGLEHGEWSAWTGLIVGAAAGSWSGGSAYLWASRFLASRRTRAGSAR